MKVVANLQLLPLGREDITPHVALCLKLLHKAQGLKVLTHVNDTTVIEGEWDDVMGAVKACHERVHVMGCSRINTNLSISSVSTAINGPSTITIPVARKESDNTSPREFLEPGSGASSADTTRVVLDVMAHKTGYEVELMESEMELETELGIDSLKRVDILTEVQNRLGIQVKATERLARSRTVGDVVEVMLREVEASGAREVRGKRVPDSYSATFLFGKAATKIVKEVVAAKTGYEMELIEMDLDLETELGIDSIKRHEMMSEVQSNLGVEVQDIERLQRTRTVGDVVDAMITELALAKKPRRPSMSYD